MRQISDIAACAAVAVAVLGVGGVHTPVALAVAMLAAVAAIGAIYRRGDDESESGRDVYVSCVGGAFALLTLWSAVQLVPLPDFAHRLLNPEGLELTRAGLEVAGVTLDGWRPLSLDPAATADRALRFAALFGIALWGANTPTRKARWKFARFGIGLGLVTLIVGGVLHAKSAHSYFGLYDSVVGFRGPSTFISLNHGAVFFGWAALVAASLGHRLRTSGKLVPSAFTGLAAILFAVTSMYHRSDGALVALVGSALLAAILAASRIDRPEKLPRDVKLGVSLIALLSLALAYWLDVFSAIISFLSRVVLSGEHGVRWELVRAGASATADYWPGGAGGGAVETVIPAYIDWGVVGVASIPVLENDTFELLVGYGVIIGGLAIAAFVAQTCLLVKPAFDGSRGVRHAMALVAAVYFGAIARVHFPLFALGVGIPFVAWLELLWSRRGHASKGRRVFASGHVRLPRGGGLALFTLITSLATLAAVAHFRWSNIELPTDPSEETTAQFIWSRPADHRVYVRLATLAAKAGDVTRAVKLSEHAVDREPSPRVALHRARVLALDDPEASAEAYAELFAAGSTGGRYLTAMLIDIRTPERRADLLAPYPSVWEPAANMLLRDFGPDDASTFIVEIASRNPDDPEAYRVASRLYLRMGQPVLARLWAELLAEREAVLPAEDRNAPVFLAQALLRAGKREEAQRVVDRVLESNEPKPPAHRMALQLRSNAFDDVDPELVEKTREHYRRLCVSPIPRADLRQCWGAEAWLAEVDGEFGKAQRVLTRFNRRLGDPMPLGRFYLRTLQCRPLRTLALSMKPGDAHRGAIETLAERCAKTIAPR